MPGPGDKQRDTERELRLKAQLDKELPFEAELTRWFPLWEIPSSRWPRRGNGSGADL